MDHFGTIRLWDGERLLELENNGGVPVNIQDQTTPPFNILFSRSISNFTIAADTTASGVTVETLINSFTASAGHGIVLGSEILLLDVASDASFYAVVTAVNVNEITVDRQVDHAFPAATALGRIVSTNMNVNGSVTPVIFSARAGEIPLDFTKFIMTMISNTAMDDGRFGSLAALTNGLVFRIVNSYQKTIFCFKTNGEIAQFGINSYSDKAPGGQYGITSYLNFAGQDQRGVTLRISTDDVLQWVVQDDLTGLDSLCISGIGHEVT